MKRLVETLRWQDNFYMELHPYPKLLLSYMYDNCDVCGAIDYNQNLWLTQIQGESKDKKRYSQFTKQDLVNALEDLKPKLLSDKKKKLFIKDFLKHQNKLPLIKGNEEHELIISKLESNLPKFNDAPEILNILNNHVIDPNEIKTTKGRVSKKKIFVEPTFEELKAYYLKEKPDAKLSSIEDIYDHYVGCGWVVGKNKPMVDWEACVRRAIRNEEQFSKSKRSYNTNSGDNKKSRTEVTLSVVDKLTKNNN
jgi:hypothetical protein